MLDLEKVRRFQERGVIEIAPLAFMRGRTLNNSFIILDEAQNTTPEQMMMFLNLNVQGIIVASIFWGLWLFPLGYLIYKSGYFPKFVGVAVIFGGIGYLLDSFMKIIFPVLDVSVATSILTMGEMVFVLWIIFFGAKLNKHRKSFDNIDTYEKRQD